VFIITNGWTLNYTTKSQGQVIFIRRTTDQECVEAMEHTWIVKGAGTHKFVRAEVVLTKNMIAFCRIRRRESNRHERIATADYHFSN
jgi:hypothetical protein